MISKTPICDKASGIYAKWIQTPICGSVCRQLELENRELRFLIKNPNRKRRLKRHRRNKKWG